MSESKSFEDTLVGRNPILCSLLPSNCASLCRKNCQDADEGDIWRQSRTERAVFD